MVYTFWEEKGRGNTMKTWKASWSLIASLLVGCISSSLAHATPTSYQRSSFLKTTSWSLWKSSNSHIWKTLAKRPTKRLKQPVVPRVRPLPLPQATTSRISSRSLLMYALKNNSTLQRMLQKVRILQSKVHRTGTWSEPKIGVQATNFPLLSMNPTQTAMSGIVYSISQRFPLSKQLALRKSIVRIDIRKVHEQIREKKTWIAFQIVRTLRRIEWFRAAWKMDAELHRWMEQIRPIVRTKYTVGKASQSELLQIDIVQSEIRLRVLRWQNQEKVSRHRLAQLVGSAKSTWSTLSHTTLPKRQLLSVAQILQSAQKQRGILRFWKEHARQARVLLSWARARFWPDLTVQFAIRQRFKNPMDEGHPFVSLGLKIPLPSWKHSARSAWIKEAMKRHQEARLHEREQLQRIRERVNIARTQYTLYQRQIRWIQKRTLALKVQNYQTLLNQYQVERAGFQSVIRAIRGLYKEKIRVARLKMLRDVRMDQMYAASGQWALK